MDAPKVKKIDYDEDLKTIWIHDEIDKDLSTEFLKTLQYLVFKCKLEKSTVLVDNFYSKNDLKELNHCINKINKIKNRILLRISSDGGIASMMLAALDYIDTCGIKVDSLIEVQSCSAASILASSVNGYRMIDKSSTYMLHDISYVLKEESSYAKQHENELKCVDFWRDRMAYYMSKRSKGKSTEEFIKENLFKEYDLYLTPKEVLKYGLVDEII